MNKFILLACLLSPLALAAPPLGVVNPAVTQANIAQTLCVPGWTATVRPPVAYTNALKRQLMAAAGLPWAQASQYELDHVMAIEDGGHPTDPANLKLQPWDGPGGAHDKDHEENRVHKAICAGQLTLEQGQQALRDWIGAHARYVGE